jgi:nucleotide-binding universal stress UspA family protein
MKFLATVDGSPESEAILPQLALLAKGSDTTVTLLMVAEPPPVEASLSGPEEADRGQQIRVELSAGSGQYGGPTGSDWPRTQGGPHEFRGQSLESAKDEAQRYLHEKAAELRAAGVEADTAVVLDEKPAQAIITFATDQKPDLIAMSTHGRSGLNELVHGSVAGAVVRAGIAPVLLTRPAG